MGNDDVHALLIRYEKIRIGKAVDKKHVVEI
jgi:hypothetical protein